MKMSHHTSTASSAGNPASPHVAVITATPSLTSLRMRILQLMQTCNRKDQHLPLTCVATRLGCVPTRTKPSQYLGRDTPCLDTNIANARLGCTRPSLPAAAGHANACPTSAPNPCNPRTRCRPPCGQAGLIRDAGMVHPVDVAAPLVVEQRAQPAGARDAALRNGVQRRQEALLAEAARRQPLARQRQYLRQHARPQSSTWPQKASHIRHRGFAAQRVASLALLRRSSGSGACHLPPQVEAQWYGQSLPSTA